MTFGAIGWLGQGKSGVLVCGDRHEKAEKLEDAEIAGNIRVACLEERIEFRNYDRAAFDIPGEYLPQKLYQSAAKNGRMRLLVTTPPPNGGMKHWLGGYFFNQPHRLVIRATICDNPYLLNTKYLSMLEMQDAVTRKLWIDGTWRANG